MALDLDRPQRRPGQHGASLATLPRHVLRGAPRRGPHDRAPDLELLRPGVGAALEPTEHPRVLQGAADEEERVLLQENIELGAQEAVAGLEGGI